MDVLLPGGVVGRNRAGGAHRVGPHLHGNHAAMVDPSSARQLHRARRGTNAAAALLRRGQVHQARVAQGRLRPGQRLRAQPEHPAESRRRPRQMSSMLGAISGDCSATGNGPLPKVALLCTVAYQTLSGQIVANGMLKLGTSSVLPIVGETGAYAPARGTLTTDVTPAKGFSEADRITLSRRPQSLPRRFDINVARGPRARADRTGATNSPTRAARATLGHPAPQRTAACFPRP